MDLLDDIIAQQIKHLPDDKGIYENYQNNYKRLKKDIKSFKTSFFTIITINLVNKSFSAFFCKLAVINNIIMDNLASVCEKKVIYNRQSK